MKEEVHKLNLLGIACPLNFVKTKIYLDKLDEGALLEVILDAGEPVESVFNSIKAEGHQVEEPKMTAEGSYLLNIKKVTLMALLCLCLEFPAVWAQASALNMKSLPNNPASSTNSIQNKFNIEEQLQLAEQAVILAPTDVEKRHHWARLLRRSGHLKRAAIEYLNIAVVNPSYSVAYHEMLLCKPSVGQIDEAIARLKKLTETKSKQLSSKMMLSELYEGKEDYYQAARVLVDLQYTQSIPQKYVSQIASRVHMLLGKTKDIRTVEKAIEQKTNVEDEEFNPSTPVPMPDVTVTTDTPANKLRSAKVKEGYGHAQLLP